MDYRTIYAPPSIILEHSLEGLCGLLRLLPNLNTFFLKLFNFFLTASFTFALPFGR